MRLRQGYVSPGRIGLLCLDSSPPRPVGRRDDVAPLGGATHRVVEVERGEVADRAGELLDLPPLDGDRERGVLLALHVLVHADRHRRSPSSPGPRRRPWPRPARGTGGGSPPRSARVAPPRSSSPRPTPPRRRDSGGRRSRAGRRGPAPSSPPGWPRGAACPPRSRPSRPPAAGGGPSPRGPRSRGG